MTNNSQNTKANYTTGGHKLPDNWLSRIVLIWGGNALSAIAGSAASFAGIWYVTESTGSPLYIAALYVLAFLPMGLLSPFGGVIADKYNRKAIIIICDTVLALTGIGIAVWIALLGPSVESIMLFCASWGFASAFRGPAFNATMPFLVPERHLIRINSLDTLLGSISMIAAPALGILLYTAFGLQASIVLGGFGSLCAVLTMLLAKLPKLTTEEQTGVVKSLKEGIFALAEQKGLLVLTIGVSLGMFAYGPLDSLLPLMVNSQFGGDGFAASLLAAIMGAGMLVGAVALMVVNPKTRLAHIIIGASIIVGACAFIAGFIPKDNFPLFVFAIGVLAIACAWFNAPLMTLLQKNIPEEKLGRVMGLFTAMTGLAIPLGTAVGGVIAEIIGTPLFFSADGIFILLIGASIALSKEVRKLSR